MNLICGRAPSERVRVAFANAGIDRCAVIDLEAVFSCSRIIRDYEESVAFVKEKRHGTMQFLEAQLLAKRNPQLLLAGARSAVMVVVPYNGFESSQPSILASISRYAHVRDYHRGVKKALINAAQSLGAALGAAFDYRGFVDSAPLLERSLARESGLGFIGKHTCLVVPGVGSFAFIASLVTTLAASELVDEKDAVSVAPGVDLGRSFCGECSRCISACPSGALKEGYRIDASRCFSYLSIEHRGLVEDNLVPLFAHGIFGCDLCQEACPHNRIAKSNGGISPVLAPFVPPEISVEDIATMSQKDYELWFGGTSLTRAKCDGLVRNAIYFLFATKSPQLENALRFWEARDCGFIGTVVQQVRSLLSDKSENKIWR